MPPILTLKDITLTFGGEPLIDGASFALSKDDRACLVGRNGAGKSTLLRMASGEVEFDTGERFVQPGVSLSYLAQDPDLSEHTQIRDFVATGLRDDQREDAYRVDAALDEVGLSPDADPTLFSGGEARRSAIARALVSEPDILLLDEPTNHLDLVTIEWLERRLNNFAGAIIMISHDRTFLKRMTNTCFWLDRGCVRTLNKGYGAFDTWQEKVLQEEEEERRRLDKKIERETHWLHRGVTARRARNMGRLRKLNDLRQQRQSLLGPTENIGLRMETGDASGKMVIEAKSIAKTFGDRQIVQPFSTRILRGDRIGIIGPNGSGKTTLLRMLTGRLKPDTGSVRLGKNLTEVFVEQDRAALDPDKTLWQTLAPKGGDQVNVHGKPRHVVAYLKDFLFDERQARQPVGSLSGGEQNRLLLAVGLSKPANMLVLDEPTNDLDMDTLDLLADMLSEFEGTILLVSHDRDFLDRTVTSTIVFEGDGDLTEYAGGYEDYLSQRRQSTSQPRPTKREGGQKSQKPASGNRATGAKKLSYKFVRELEELGTQMSELTERISNLEHHLADADAFEKDAEAFAKNARALEDAKSKLEKCEERWLELELMREEAS